jgi:hypothetical protein
MYSSKTKKGTSLVDRLPSRDPVCLSSRGRQATVILAELHAGKFPFPLYSGSTDQHPLRAASLKNPVRLFHLSARHLRNRLRMVPVRECCHLAAPAFTVQDSGRTFYRSLAETNIHPELLRMQVFSPICLTNNATGLSTIC